MDSLPHIGRFEGKNNFGHRAEISASAPPPNFDYEF